MIPAVTNSSLITIVLALACMHIILCNRVRVIAVRMGLPAAKWFILSLLLTPIPAMIVFWWYNVQGIRRRQRGRFRHLLSCETSVSGEENAPRRCPNCGELIVSDEGRHGGALPTCPHCGLGLDEDTVA